MADLFKQINCCSPDSGNVTDENNFNTEESPESIDKIWKNYREKKLMSFTTAQIAVQVINSRN